MTEERRQYLKDLAEEHDIDEDIVFMMADILGENEDNDGLITSLQDMSLNPGTPRRNHHAQ